MNTLYHVLIKDKDTRKVLQEHIVEYEDLAIVWSVRIAQGQYSIILTSINEHYRLYRVYENTSGQVDCTYSR